MNHNETTTLRARLAANVIDQQRQWRTIESHCNAIKQALSVVSSLEKYTPLRELLCEDWNVGTMADPVGACKFNVYSTAFLSYTNAALIKMEVDARTRHVQDLAGDWKSPITLRFILDPMALSLYYLARARIVGPHEGACQNPRFDEEHPDFPHIIILTEEPAIAAMKDPVFATRAKPLMVVPVRFAVACFSCVFASR